MITMLDITLHVIISLCMLFLSLFHVFGEEMNFTTQETRSYTIVSNHGVSVDDRRIIFKVKACGHAYVGLMSGPTESDPLHEIVFGGDYNSASFVRAGKSYSLPDLVRIDVPILDCNQHVEFWITWNDNTIDVGLGLQVTGSVFLTWTSSNPLLAIQNIGIATAHGSVGEWTFYTEDNIQTTTSRITDVSTKLYTSSVGSTKISSSSTSKLAVDDITTGLQTTDSKQTPTCAAPCVNTYTCKCPNSTNRPPTSIPTIPLKLDKKTLSSYRNQHMSATDSRKSSFYIGCVGITVLVLSVAFIAILDFVPSA